MKNKKIWLILLIIVMVICATVAVGIMAYNGSDAVRFKKQLDLGQKYLSEMNYEEAVVAFNQAIEIDPRSVDAYLGLADAYIGLGDEEAALAALQTGYEATGDERLKARIDEINAAREALGGEAALPAEENDEIADRVEEIGDFISMETTIGYQSTTGDKHLLTYEQNEALFRPLAEELETYLEQEEGSWEGDAWYELGRIYCHLGEMDKCLEARRRGYELTGVDYLAPEVNVCQSGNTEDEYGRPIESDAGTRTYGEGDRYITWDGTTGSGYPFHSEYEYDDLGRTAIVYASVANPESGEIRSDRIYEYHGDNTVTVTTNYSTFSSVQILTYNEYGVVIDWTEPVDIR